jgi:predicted lipoprotein
MKRIVVFFFVGAGALLLLLNFSCSKGNPGSTTPVSKDSILLNIGNNIIMPAYQSLATAVNSLDSSITDFNASPNGTKLSNVQSLFIIAYTNWQSVSEYNYLGPAANNQPVLTTLNIFPTTDSLINANISQSDYNVNTFLNTSAKGFPALDYLLFGAGNNTLTNYTTDSKATNRQKYLAAVSADIKTEVNNVLNGWSANGGNYINTFVSGSGSSVSSSLGLLLNSLDQDFEILKNNRLGIPLGKIPVGSSLPLAPTYTEGYYSGISVQLALTQLKTIQGIYLGTAEQGNGLGLINYLQKAEQQNSNLKYNGGLLSDTLKADFAVAVSELQAIPDPLSQNLSNPNASTAFAECQLLVTLLKTDMPSDLGVLINYGDNDGD